LEGHSPVASDNKNYLAERERDGEGYSADQPSEGSPGQQEVGDKSYIVLRNGSGILAVYRVRNDDVLKRLRRWPADLGTAANGRSSGDWRLSG
jgi:hypothetical protein